MRNKSHQPGKRVTIRLNANERRLLEWAANMAGITISDVIREAIPFELLDAVLNHRVMIADDLPESDSDEYSGA